MNQRKDKLEKGIYVTSHLGRVEIQLQNQQNSIVRCNSYMKTLSGRLL